MAGPAEDREVVLLNDGSFLEVLVSRNPPKKIVSKPGTIQRTPFTAAPVPRSSDLSDYVRLARRGAWP
jgi:hypothetical protein